jgi:hypothetical protein
MEESPILFDIRVYSSPEGEEDGFLFSLGVNEEYHKIVLKEGYSISSVVVSLTLAFLMSYCEKSYLDFDDEVEKALLDYTKADSIELGWIGEDDESFEETSEG